MWEGDNATKGTKEVKKWDEAKKNHSSLNFNGRFPIAIYLTS
jgi:hypothetical protein